MEGLFWNCPWFPVVLDHQELFRAASVSRSRTGGVDHGPLSDGAVETYMFSPHGGGVQVCRSSSSGSSRSSATLLQFSQALGGVSAGPMCHSNHWPSIFEKVTNAECAHGGIMTPGTGG